MSFIKALPEVLAKTANYTVTTNDGDNVHVNVNATAGATTITLYAASGNSGKIVSVKKTDSSTYAVTIDGNASETLDGALTQVLSAQYDTQTYVSDGTNWHRVSQTGATATDSDQNILSNQVFS
jgi:hypothetical protein